LTKAENPDQQEEIAQALYHLISFARFVKLEQMGISCIFVFTYCMDSSGIEMTALFSATAGLVKCSLTTNWQSKVDAWNASQRYVQTIVPGSK